MKPIPAVSRLYLAAAILLLFQSGQAGEEPPAIVAELPGAPRAAAWTRLHYAADGRIGSVSTTLELANSSLQDMQSAPYTALENTAFQIIASPLMRIDIQARATSLFGDSGTRGTLWFDPATGAVLQRDKLRPGWKGSRKIYRFGEDGALRLRLKPKDRAEAEQPSDEWSKTKESFFPYNLHDSGCEFVSDPILLLYLVSLPEYINANRSAQTCLFFDDALYRVRLEPQGSDWLDVNYTVKSAAGRRRVQGRQESLKLLLRIEPLTAGADRANFELLELRGTIVIHLNTGSRLPVQVSGERAGLGRLRIALVEAESD
ncbi:MAG: hypothetical protein PVJ15_03185 [Gammaproteobacteria bacterium]